MSEPLVKLAQVWASLFLLATVAFWAPAAQALDAKPLFDNFDQVAANIYRGANPSEADLDKLQKLGVTTIVDLRMMTFRRADQCAKRHGMECLHVPLGYWAPSDKSIRHVLDILKQASNDKAVFIHCAQGADRTGTIIAIYRMTVQNWSYNEAYREMRAHHFKPWWFALKEKVETWDEHLHDAAAPVSAQK